MKPKSFFAFAVSLVLIVITSFVCGCGSEDKAKKVYSKNIRKLHLGYTMCMEDNDFVGPEDEAELKNYMKTNPTAVHLLKRLDVTPESVDDIFLSERDGKPFVVRYGVKGEANHAVIFEAEGVDGKRFVALIPPTEVDEETYDGYLSEKIKPQRPEAFGFGENVGRQEESEE